MIVRALLSGTALLVAVPAAAAPDPLAAELKARTQRLLDAIATGDQAVWAAALDPKLIYVTESNEVLTRDELLKQIEPLPKGLSGTVKVTDFRLKRSGDVAVATFVADETENYHGQTVKTKYRTTATWRRAGRPWKMISSMTLAVLDDPPSIDLPSETLQQYVGRYELDGETHYVVTAENGRLSGQREGGKQVELKAESPDLFFVSGSPRSRKVFYRDAAGRVVGFGDRREGHDIAWKRIS